MDSLLATVIPLEMRLMVVWIWWADVYWEEYCVGGDVEVYDAIDPSF